MKKRLKYFSSPFKKAIINSNKKFLPPTLKNFPKGSCGDASLLLAKYLKEHKIYPTYYISGKKTLNKDDKPKPLFHAWLEYNDFVIDITADQLDEINDFVIITNNRNWHSQFKIRDRHIADYNRYDPGTVLQFEKAYKQIIDNLS